MSNEEYLVFFVSDRTAITAEAVGMTLLSQFPNLAYTSRHIPFVNTKERAEELVESLKEARIEYQDRVIVFATIPDVEISRMLDEASCHYYELFNYFVKELSKDLNLTAVPESGVQHGMRDLKDYDSRMDVVNFSLMHDDAMSFKHLDQADVILVGVSRSGKTPTCLYLALHYGLRAANYPLTEDDFEKGDLPKVLKDRKDKLIALTISPQRLAAIREKRRSSAHYSSLKVCQAELRQAQQLFKRYRLTVLDTTSSSIEELAAKIVQLNESKNTH